jgi:hypothetical protein
MRRRGNPPLPLARRLSYARALWGLSLIGAPARLAAALGAGGASDPLLLAVIRVLGGRELAQGAVCWLRPECRVVLTGAAVDATHSASMILLATRAPKFRRLAAASATVSGVLAACGLGQGLMSSRQPGGDGGADPVASRAAARSRPRAG